MYLLYRIHHATGSRMLGKDTITEVTTISLNMIGNPDITYLVSGITFPVAPHTRGAYIGLGLLPYP